VECLQVVWVLVGEGEVTLRMPLCCSETPCGGHALQHSVAASVAWLACCPRRRQPHLRSTVLACCCCRCHQQLLLPVLYQARGPGFHLLFQQQHKSTDGRTVLEVCTCHNSIHLYPQYATTVSTGLSMQPNTNRQETVTTSWLAQCSQHAIALANMFQPLA
jgi:hypothetical protein